MRIGYTLAMRQCRRCDLEVGEYRHTCEGCGQVFQAPSLRLAQASLTLALLSYPLVCVLGLGAITALVAIGLGMVALLRARGAVSEDSGKSSAIAGILLGAALPVISMVPTWPALSRDRQGHNEKLTIGDIRAVFQAEVQYSNANDGHYDTLECLAAPALCIPKYDPAKPAFLDALRAWTGLRNGYTLTFYPGPPPKGPRPAGTSPSSMSDYAYVAMPQVNSNWRSFCGDGTGRMCAIEGGAPPVVKDGRCPESCPDLR